MAMLTEARRCLRTCLIVSRQELARLKKRFATLLPADSTSLLLPIPSFLLMPELRLYPYVPLVTALVARRNAEDSDSTSNAKENAISYAQFLTLLATLSGKQSLESKRRGNVLPKRVGIGGLQCLPTDRIVRLWHDNMRSSALRRV